MSTSEGALVVLPRTLFGRIATGLRAFRRLIRNPADPLHGPLFQMCAEHSLLRRLTRRLERHGEGQRLLAERPRLTAGSVSRASTCPPRSLGRAYAHYFTANGIAPFDPPALPVETNQDYVATRLREAHDVFHVVTGYGTDEIGELELQWFNLGNLGWGPLPFIMLVAFCFMGHAKHHGGLWAVFKRARAAYRRGKRSRALASMYWEDYWHLPLGDVRTLLCAPVEARASSS
jgi:ubiquinone biosynthesis protein COQ4